MKPLDFRIVAEKELLITWEDGKRCLYAVPYLQLACRCAHCTNEWTGERVIAQKDIDDRARLLEIEPVGNYALRFKWSSGCMNGIYSFDYLRSLCPAR
jgi:DUF971 family protein